PLHTLAQQEGDSYATWMSVGLEKSLPKGFSVGVDAELRAGLHPRYSVAAGVSYKPLKYLKLGVGYTFIDRYKRDEREEHYKNDIVDEAHWNGFDQKPSYWQHAHRALFDVTGTVKLWKWLRLSVRERYQYTHRTATTIYEHKERYDIIKHSQGGEKYYTYEMKDGYPIEVPKEKEATDEHVLRSRLKLEVDKKKWVASPFIFAEAYNQLNNKMMLQKVRASAGCSFQITKHFEMTAAYVLTAGIHQEVNGEIVRNRERVHAFSLGCLVEL
ncbi:MAG: DUF2490 domain-containing protein, partial [Bacteroidaceae bacterium]|nr:DUF2490 domain-containing protein [Bacteroidaceae bacterium]